MYDENETIYLRNVGIPLALAKPNIYIKILLSGLLTLLTMVLFNTIFSIRVDYHEVVLMVLIIFFLWFYGTNLESLYVYMKEKKNIELKPFAIIGFSNKLLILAGENVLDEIDTDEIEIRKLTKEEREKYFWYTSAVCAKKEGEIISVLYVDGISNYEGTILNADMNRVDEDIEVIYDEDEDNNDENQVN